MSKVIVQLLIDDQILNKFKTICYEAGIKFEIAVEESMREVIEKWVDPAFREEWFTQFRK